MDTISPYLPIPTDLSQGHLISIKQASARYTCSCATLKNNAKAGHLRAFQQRAGLTVFVLPSDVEEFLKFRPDIGSVFHRGGAAPAPPVWQGTISPDTRAPWESQVSQIYPVPPAHPTSSDPLPPPSIPSGIDLGNRVPAGWARLESLSSATQSDLAILIAFTTEIARILTAHLAKASAQIPPPPKVI